MAQRGSSKLRIGRYSEENRIYFVTTVVEKRNPVFNSFELGRILVNVLRYEVTLGEIESLAFVVMPDHLHWLIQLNSNGDVSRSVGRVKAISGRKVNQLIGTSGKLWQAGFHDHALRRDEDLKYFARYLVANPLRARLVRSLRDYPLWDAVWI